MVIPPGEPEDFKARNIKHYKSSAISHGQP